MTKREILLEQLEETVFALMMEDVAKEEGRRALEENAHLKADESAAVPKTVYRKGLATIRRHFSQKNRRVIMHTTSKVISRVAVIVLVMLLLFTTAFATIPELRAKTIKVMVETFDDRSTIGLISREESKPSTEMEGTLAGWIPTGFELIDKGNEETVNWECYSDGRDAYLEFFVFVGDNYSYDVNTEYAEVTEVIIGEYTGMQITRGRKTHIVVFDTENGLIYDTLGENISQEDVVYAAEKRNFFKK